MLIYGTMRGNFRHPRKRPAARYRRSIITPQNSPIAECDLFARLRSPLNPFTLHGILFFFCTYKISKVLDLRSIGIIRITFSMLLNQNWSPGRIDRFAHARANNLGFFSPWKRTLYVKSFVNEVELMTPNFLSWCLQNKIESIFACDVKISIKWYCYNIFLFLSFPMYICMCSRIDYICYIIQNYRKYSSKLCVQ